MPNYDDYDYDEKILIFDLSITFFEIFVKLRWPKIWHQQKSWSEKKFPKKVLLRLNIKTKWTKFDLEMNFQIAFLLHWNFYCKT